uniref:SCP domain-containing protein n=1 Tax=Caenorhabditis tropicalis TaxID=1561998 RepID=A0A1I7TDQ5_9PELO
MAWATSGSIGCGVKNCGKDPNLPTYNLAVVVCHYKSLGNLLNEPIYIPGVTCSQCPTGTTCETATGLCA